MQNQDSIFVESEANEWFKRNQPALLRPEKIPSDYPLRLLSFHKELRPRRVLEIGCANGWRLSEIERRYGSVCVGVEPSDHAIEDGKSRYPNVQFYKGLAARLPVRESFDLVIVNFVLHWISRESLLSSASEIDRVTQKNGFLLISDFLPDSPELRDYHHLPGKVFTYKQDYAQLFLASNLYSQVSRITFDHDDSLERAPVFESSVRAVVSLLRKSTSEFYRKT